MVHRLDEFPHDIRTDIVRRRDRHRVASGLSERMGRAGRRGQRRGCGTVAKRPREPRVDATVRYRRVTHRGSGRLWRRGDRIQR
jgi:hypothetical protein